MFALATFNVLSHNRDDHARQFTFLMSRDGRWRLAPAYDLTFAPGPGGEHSTPVLGRGKDIDRERLLALARYADLKDAEARDIIDCVANAVADWDRFAASCDVRTPLATASPRRWGRSKCPAARRKRRTAPAAYSGVNVNLSTSASGRKPWCSKKLSFGGASISRAPLLSAVPTA